VLYPVHRIGLIAALEPLHLPFTEPVAFCLDDATLTGAPRKMLLGSWERLREPDSIVIDNSGYILLFRDEPLELDRELEMNDHKVKIVEISDASVPFLSSPVIHTRYSEAVNFGITITIALVVGTVVAGQTFYLFTLLARVSFALGAIFRRRVHHRSVFSSAKILK